jgi:hypothetical protein
MSGETRGIGTAIGVGATATATSSGDLAPNHAATAVPGCGFDFSSFSAIRRSASLRSASSIEATATLKA